MQIIYINRQTDTVNWQLAIDSIVSTVYSLEIENYKIIIGTKNQYAFINFKQQYQYLHNDLKNTIAFLQFDLEEIYAISTDANDILTTSIQQNILFPNTRVNYLSKEQLHRQLELATRILVI